MKRVILILFFSIMSCLCFSQSKVFLVGIGDYPSTNGWSKINAANDIRILQKTFHNSRITVLQDCDATYDGIISAMEKFTDSLSKGDTVIVHFSCHGQQMLPLSEIPTAEPDSLDESLIPYDALHKYSNSYKGNKHLRDDELTILINKVRAKVGEKGFVIVTLDACHSDGLHRSPTNTDVVYRGSSTIFGNLSEAALKSLSAKQYQTESGQISLPLGYSHVIYIHACRSNQVNRETIQNGLGYGSLSYSIYQTYQPGCLNDIPSFIASLKSRMSKLAPIQNIVIRSSINLNSNSASTPPPAKKKTTALERLLNIF